MLSNVNLLISHRRTKEAYDRFWFIDEALLCKILKSGIKVFANKDLIKDEEILEHELFHHSASFAEFSGQMTAEGSGLTEMLPGLDTSNFRTQIRGPHFYVINPDELTDRILPSVNALYLIDSDKDLRDHLVHISTLDLDSVMGVMRSLVLRSKTKTMTNVMVDSVHKLTYNAGVSGHEFMFWVGSCIGNRYKAGHKGIDLDTMREMILTSSVQSRLSMSSLFFLAMGYDQDNDKEIQRVTKEVCNQPLSVFPEDANILDCIGLGEVADGSDLDGFVLFDVLWAPNNVMRLGITDDVCVKTSIIVLNSCEVFDTKTKDTCLDLNKHNINVLFGNLLEMFYLEATHAVHERPRSLVRGWTLANAAVVQSIISNEQRRTVNI